MVPHALHSLSHSKITLRIQNLHIPEDPLAPENIDIDIGCC